MVKVMNIVFGIGIAVIIFIVALLGIQTFYPSPEYEKFCKPDYYAAPVVPVSTIYDCQGNITVTECIKQINIAEVNSSEYKAREQEMQKCNTDFNKAEENYGKIYLIIGVILGLTALIVSFYLLRITNISAGVASAGIVLLIVAFVRGWHGTNDTLKFIASLIVGVVVVFLTIKVNKRFADAPVKKKKK